MRSCAATSLLHLEFSILYLHWPLSNFRNIKSIESLSKAKETNLSQLWCEIVNSASFIPFINPSRFWLPWLTYFHVKVLGNFQFLILILVRYIMLLKIKANTCNFAHIMVETVIRGLCFESTINNRLNLVLQRCILFSRQFLCFPPRQSCSPQPGAEARSEEEEVRRINFLRQNTLDYGWLEWERGERA